MSAGAICGRTGLVVLAVVLATLLAGCSDDASYYRHKVQEKQLEQCKAIKDEALRVDCIKGVKA